MLNNGFIHGVTAMLRAHLLGLFLTVAGVSLAIAGDDDKLASGPKAGTMLPGPFECFNVNGPAKGRHHCLVCKFALNPSVLIFAKERTDGKDEALTDLLKKLDDMAPDFDDRTFSVGVVFLSPDARDSTNNSGEVDADKIIEEAVNREKLNERLKKRAEPLKHVIVAHYLPEGPKSYNLNPKAEITALYYDRMKVAKVHSFAPGRMQIEDADAIVKQVRDALTVAKKKA